MIFISFYLFLIMLHYGQIKFKKVVSLVNISKFKNSQITDGSTSAIKHLAMFNGCLTKIFFEY